MSFGVQHSLLIGSLMGDASMSKVSSKTARLSEYHAVDQADYVKWKHKLWGKRANPIHRYPPHNHIHQDSIGFSVKASKDLMRWWRLFYDHSDVSCDGKTRKRFPPEIVPLVTPLALAVWYMDDGFGQHWPSFSCHERSHGVALAVLKQFGIHGTPAVGQSSCVHIANEHQAEMFLRIIEPHIIPSMRYKLTSTSPRLTIHIEAEELQQAVKDGADWHQLKQWYPVTDVALKRRLKEAGVWEHVKDTLVADLMETVELVPTGARPRIRLPHLLLEDLFKLGYLTKEIAKRFGVTVDVVKRHLVEYGLVEPTGLKTGQVKLVRELRGKEMAVKKIAKQLNVPTTSLRNLMNRNGIS